MIVCPNCNHQNPEGSIQCESCYTPLPSTSPCPNCGAAVQIDATFCGQCGFNLQAEQFAKQDEVTTNPFIVTEEAQDNSSLENTVPTAANNTPIVSPWDQDNNDMTLEEAMSVDDTEIMASSESSPFPETPWTTETPNTGAMPWENLDLESSSELPELSDINTSDLEIPELPELNLELPDEGSDVIPELPELNLELPDEGSDVIPELPELNLELPDEGSDVIPKLPELNLELPDEGSDVIPELPELNLELPDEGSDVIPELPELNLELPDEGSDVIPELPELDFAAAEAVEETPEFSEANLDTPEAMEETPEFSELNLDTAEVMEEIPEFSELDFAAAEAVEETPEFSEAKFRYC